MGAMVRFFAFFLLIGIIFPASAAEVLQEFLYRPEQDEAEIVFFRRNHTSIRQTSQGEFGRVAGKRAGWRVNCAAEPENTYFEFCFPGGKKLSDFTVAEVRIQVFLPVNHSVDDLNLRLQDVDGEVFQFRRKLPAGKNRWTEISYHVETNAPKAESWGGGKKANKKLDAPLRLVGITGDLKRTAGEIGIGEVVLNVINSNAPVLPEVMTGSGTPIHVLKPGEEEKLALEFRNPRPRMASAVAEWQLIGVRGETLEKRQQTLRLSPGEVKLRKLPVPKQFGVYRILTEVKDSDPAVKPVKKELRFAYMKPAGPTPLEKNDGFLFGVCSHPQRHVSADQDLEAMAAAWCGVKALREDIDWARIQPARNRWEFQSFDGVVRRFGKVGIDVMPILSYCPAWAAAADWKPKSLSRANATMNRRPDYEYWRQFLRKVAERYRNAVRFMEVWNEPDLAIFANFSAEEYVKMLETAYAEIKNTAPEIQVLTGGFSNLPERSSPQLMPAVIRSGKYDVLAFHGHGLFGGYLYQITRICSAYGNRKPWFANETALSSMVYGEEVQAQTLFRKLIYSWAKGSIGYNWYDLRNDGFDPANNEHNFGMITADFYPKPVYVAYNSLANLYRGGTFLKPLSLGSEIHGYLFRGQDGGMLLAAWSDTGDDRILPLAVSGVTGSAETVDLYGNVRKLPVKNGVAIFEIGQEPATLCVSGQTEEIQVAGALVRPAGKLEIVPGGHAVFAFEIYNPEHRSREYHVQLSLPPGLSQTAAVTPLRLAPGENRKVGFPVRAEESFRSLPGKTKELMLSLGDRSFRYRIETVTLMPARGYHSEPDFELNSAEQVYSLVPNSPETAHLFWKGPRDLSAKIWLGRDGNNLLLRAEVVDDRHTQPYTGERVWQGDNIQFAMVLPGQKGNWEIGLTRTDAKRPEVHVWLAPERFQSAKTASQIVLNTSREEKTGLSRYEARIPFSAIGLTDAVMRRGFQFNLLVNDNDGAKRESFIAIAPGLGDNKDSSQYPVVRF